MMYNKTEMCTLLYQKQLLLSAKTQKSIIILPEALYNGTSGLPFQKVSPL